jgi:hypothetical protein
MFQNPDSSTRLDGSAALTMEEDTSAFMRASSLAAAMAPPTIVLLDGGAGPSVLTDIIDDSPLQNQIQKNKECKRKTRAKQKACRGIYTWASGVARQR